MSWIEAATVIAEVVRIPPCFYPFTVGPSLRPDLPTHATDLVRVSVRFSRFSVPRHPRIGLTPCLAAGSVALSISYRTYSNWDWLTIQHKDRLLASKVPLSANSPKKLTATENRSDWPIKNVAWTNGSMRIIRFFMAYPTSLVTSILLALRSSYTMSPCIPNDVHDRHESYVLVERKYWGIPVDLDLVPMLMWCCSNRVKEKWIDIYIP